MTALIWALIYGGKSGYANLLERGADANLQLGKVGLDQVGVTEGSSAMSLAARHEDNEYLKLTLTHGGDPNLLNPVRLTTPIFDAISLADRRLGNPSTTNPLMLAVAGADLDAQDANGYTPLMRAAIANRYDIVRALLDAGADPAIKAGDGNSLAELIVTIRTSPKNEMIKWRDKVVARLKRNGD